MKWVFFLKNVTNAIKNVTNTYMKNALPYVRPNIWVSLLGIYQNIVIWSEDLKYTSGESKQPANIISTSLYFFRVLLSRQKELDLLFYISWNASPHSLFFELQGDIHKCYIRRSLLLIFVGFMGGKRASHRLSNTARHLPYFFL